MNVFDKNTSAGSKPYFMAGAGRLASSVAKSGDERTGFDYRLNVFVLNADSGAVSSWLAPDDLLDLVKLSGLLAREIAMDGCIDDELRMKLTELATNIEYITRPESWQDDSSIV